MAWLFPSIVSTLCGTLILSGVYLYLFATYRERFFGIWTLSWGLYALRFVATLAMLLWGQSPSLLFVSEAATVLSAYFLFRGTALFVSAGIRPIWLWMTGALLIWTAIGIYGPLSFLAWTLPSYTLTAAVFIWMGYKIQTSILTSGAGRTVTAAAMMLWGLHKLNYPLLRHVDWFAPWGFLFGGLLSFMVAIGILLVYFEKTRNELLLAEGRSRILFEEASYGIVLADPGTGTIVDSNKAFAEMMGAAPADLIGRRQPAWHPPAGPGEEVFETRLTAAKGNVIDVEIKSQLVDHGRQVVQQSFFTDVTQRRQTEEALRKSEGRFREMAELLPETIYETDTRGRLTYVNRNAFARFGYTPDDFARGLNALDMIAPHERERAAENMRRIMSGERLGPNEFTMQGKDGSLFPAVIHSTAITQEGSPAGLRGSIVDITAIKEAEQALRKSEANYRQLFDSAPSGIYQIDFRSGKFLKANDVVCEYFGCSQDEITSRSPYDLMTAESRALLAERLEKMGRGERVSEHPEYEIVDRKGRRRWIQLNSKNITGPEGSLIGADVIAHDVTERRQSEEALVESETKFVKLFQANPAVTALSTVQGGIYIDVNQAFLDLLGYRREDVIGRTSSELGILDPEERRRVVSLLLEKKSINNIETVIRRKDGRPIPGIFSLERINLGNEDVLLTTFVDITERRKAEEERRMLEERLNRSEKMEALGTLAGGVAHDLNNVLGIVVGYAEMLLNEVDESHPIRNELMTIMKGGERAAAIVQDLLTLARRGVQGKRVINLNAAILECRKMPEFDKGLSLSPRVRLQMDLEADLLNIVGSPVHLSKTLINLVSNAVDAMPQGGLLTIATANRYLDKPVQGYDNVREGDYVVLSVSDTGEGIAANDIQHIFEPFYTRKVMGKSGTGLGLAVVWGTVKDHHGYIDVESKIGKGTTFTLYFPVTREELPLEQPPAALAEYLGRGESVLVVDDVAGQRELASRMLARLNYRVATVSCGEEALEYLRGNKVDLVFLDMIMDPGMDGLDTYRKMIELHPGQKAILVSGFSESDRVREAQALGAGAYVRKPYILERLGMAIRNELARN